MRGIKRLLEICKSLCPTNTACLSNSGFCVFHIVPSEQKYSVIYTVKMLRLIRQMHDLLWDARLHINTCRIIRRNDSISERRDARGCVPTPYFRLHMVFKRLRISNKDVFADYGCGTGRVVCVAARLPFKKVYGIELFPDIALVARRNSKNVRNRQAPVEIIVGDVWNFDCKDITVFFLYDPFGQRTMQDVLLRIHTSLLRNPRNVRIIYFDPKYVALLNRCSWLKEREDLCFRIGKHTVIFYESIP